MDYISIISIVVIFGIMYAVLIIPQKKKEKKAKAMISALAVGDTITTIGGMVGKVVNIDEDNITFESSIDRNKILVKSWAVRTVEQETIES